MVGIRRTHATLSVIVPAYNAAGTIGRALASVAAQTVKPREVIVVDDGSHDGTAEAARACASMMDGIALHVIVESHRGPGAARNRALAESESEFVAFLDADDEWLPEKLDQSLSRCADPALRLVAHNGWKFHDGKRELVDIAHRFRTAADPIHGLYRRGFISTSSVVARRRYVVEAGGFDESLPAGQDFDLWLKMLMAPGARFEVFDAPLTRYHVSDSGVTADTRRRLKNTLLIAVRHAPRVRRATGRWLGSLWFRVAALHREAAASFWRRRRPLAAAATIASLPGSLVALTLQAARAIAHETSK